MLPCFTLGADPTPLGNAWGPNGIGWSDEDWPLYILNLVITTCGDVPLLKSQKSTIFSSGMYVRLDLHLVNFLTDAESLF